MCLYDVQRRFLVLHGGRGDFVLYRCESSVWLREVLLATWIVDILRTRSLDGELFWNPQSHSGRLIYRVCCRLILQVILLRMCICTLLIVCSYTTILVIPTPYV